MTSIQDFITWFLTSLPTFLMSEPICYFVGFFFLSFTVMIVRKIIGLGNIF